VGFLAAIAVPNVLTARNRGRQKRTMADMRTIATAWEARATDLNSYSAGASHVTPAQLASVLAPTYIKRLPRTDGWGTEFKFSTDDEIAGQAQTYVIRSLGSDRQADAIADARGETHSFTADVIYSNGSFTQYPESAG
jgi:general secretion pathway protein G